MDISKMISIGDIRCCPICDSPIMDGEGWDVVSAHSYVQLVHTNCLDLNDDDVAPGHNEPETKS
jgi:hypothetical protein